MWICNRRLLSLENDNYAEETEGATAEIGDEDDYNDNRYNMIQCDELNCHAIPYVYHIWWVSLPFHNIPVMMTRKRKSQKTCRRRKLG